MQFSTFLLGGALAATALAGYTVQDDYSGDKFFDMFTFDTVRSSSLPLLGKTWQAQPFTRTKMHIDPFFEALWQAEQG